MISVQNFVVLSMSLTVKTTWPSFFTLTGVVSGVDGVALGLALLSYRFCL